jgi:hypothetical protein
MNGSSDHETKRPDAADRAPRPHRPDDKGAVESTKQDGANYNGRTDDGKALDNEDLSSANDE